MFNFPKHKLDSKTIIERIVSALSFLPEKENFKYLKSYSMFYRAQEGVVQYITINVTTPDSGRNYSLAFYFGVRNDKIEQLIKTIEGTEIKLSHFDRSIYHYSVNLGPTSPHWVYKESANWWISSESDLKSNIPSIVEFIQGICIPYVNDFLNIDRIRLSLIQNPGKNINIYPFKQVLAIDILNMSDIEFKNDIEYFDEKYEGNTGEAASKYKPFRENAIEFYKIQKTKEENTRPPPKRKEGSAKKNSA